MPQTEQPKAAWRDPRSYMKTTHKRRLARALQLDEEEDMHLLPWLDDNLDL